MTATIDLDDGRAWRAANWAYDAVVEQIAAELDCGDEEREFAVWLRAQTCLECGPGLGSVDVRELSPVFRVAFRRAAERAFQTAQLAGSAGWHSPEFFPGWIARFQELLQMWAAIDRGDPPCAVWPASGNRVGPGWDSKSDYSLPNMDQ